MLKELFIQLIKQNFLFLMVGGSAALFYLILATFFTESLNIKIWLASALAWAICIIPTYQAQKILVFKSKMHHKIAFPRYLISQVIGIILSSILSYALNELTDFKSLVVFIIVISIIILLSYILQRFWVF